MAKWLVWIQPDEEHLHGEKDLKDDKTVFEGSKTAARKYHKKHGGAKAGLHVGYDIMGDDEE